MKIEGIKVMYSFCFCSYPSDFLKGHHILVSAYLFAFSFANKYIHLATDKCSHIANITYN